MEYIFLVVSNFIDFEFINNTDDTQRNPRQTVRFLIPLEFISHLNRIVYFSETGRQDIFEQILLYGINLESISFNHVKYWENVHEINIFGTIEQFNPNLRSIELSNLPTSGHILAPQNELNLKRIKINCSVSAQRFNSLKFKQLEEFEICSRRIGDRWIEFISDLQLLKKLTIRVLKWESLAINDRQFKELARIQNLEEFTFTQGGKSISIDAIRYFLSRCKCLKRLTMVYYTNTRETQLQLLHTDFGVMWGTREDFLGVAIEKIY